MYVCGSREGGEWWLGLGGEGRMKERGVGKETYERYERLGGCVLTGQGRGSLSGRVRLHEGVDLREAETVA